MNDIKEKCNSFETNIDHIHGIILREQACNHLNKKIRYQTRFFGSDVMEQMTGFIIQIKCRKRWHEFKRQTYNILRKYTTCSNHNFPTGILLLLLKIMINARTINFYSEGELQNIL